MIEGDTTLNKWRTKVRIYHWRYAQIRPADFCKLCKRRTRGTCARRTYPSCMFIRRMAVTYFT